MLIQVITRSTGISSGTFTLNSQIIDPKSSSLMYSLPLQTITTSSNVSHSATDIPDV